MDKFAAKTNRTRALESEWGRANGKLPRHKAQVRGHNRNHRRQDVTPATRTLTTVVACRFSVVCLCHHRVCHSNQFAWIALLKGYELVLAKLLAGLEQGAGGTMRVSECCLAIGDVQADESSQIMVSYVTVQEMTCLRLAMA